MSHPDPLYDDHDDFYGADWNAVEEDNIVEDNYNDGWDDDDYYASDAMDGDHDSAMESAGWGVDEQYNTDYDYGDDW